MSGKQNIGLSIALICQTLVVAHSVQAQPAPQNVTSEYTAQQETPTTNSFEVKEFYSEGKRYTLGVRVPGLYLTKPYKITEWKKRNLPAPPEGTQWTYMAGNYVLISSDQGKLLKILSGKIFY